MLNKLLKHEYKATARFFLPAYGIFAALLGIQRLSMLAFDRFKDMKGFLASILNFTTDLMTVVTVLGFFALLACPIVYAAVRFYKNMLGDEGYLTFTLPVTTGKNIMAKFLTSMSWILVTVLVTALCGFLYALTYDAAEVWEFFRTLGGTLSEGMRLLGGWMVVAVVLFLAAVLSQLSSNLLLLYNAMSIGQTASHHKLLASAGAYVGGYFGISLVIQCIAIGGFFFFGGDLIEWLNSASYAFTAVQGCQAVCLLLLIISVGYILVSVLFYFLSRYFLGKKLNLA